MKTNRSISISEDVKREKYGLKKEDAGLIRELWEHTELIPSEVSEQGGLFGFMKSDDTKIRASRLFYLNNMIFLCRSLF